MSLLYLSCIASAIGLKMFQNMMLRLKSFQLCLIMQFEEYAAVPPVLSILRSEQGGVGRNIPAFIRISLLRNAVRRKPSF